MKKDTIAGAVVIIGVFALTVAILAQNIIPQLLHAYYLANVRDFNSTNYEINLVPVYIIAAVEIICGTAVLYFNNKK